MNKTIKTTNNTYYLFQPKDAKLTTIEKISNLTDIYKGSLSLEKNINEITEENLKTLYFTL